MLTAPIDPIIAVFFVYGLAFYTMGLALALESGGRMADREVAFAMRPLAFFGIVHGLHEWYEMFLRIGETVYGVHPSQAIEVGRVVVLVISFAALTISGCSLLYRGRAIVTRRIALLVFAVFIVGTGVLIRQLAPGWDTLLGAADVWTRYSLGITGATLTGVGLLVRAHDYANQDRMVTRGLAVAGCALALYGIIGQSAPPPSVLFPSTIYNSEVFQDLFGFPVQLLRATAALLSTGGLLVALRALEIARQQSHQAAIDAKLAAQAQAQEEMAHRETLQKELLRRTVATQEEERARIARELHDHTGQTLTALSYRAAALEAAVGNGNSPALDLAHDLRQLADQALADLRHLVTDLRPAQLDDLGLVAALHWLADQAHRRLGLEVTVEVEGRKARLPGDIETALFRIAQEALTNAARHARVEFAKVRLSFGPFVTLEVVDEGVGFDVAGVHEAALLSGERAWGLIGMEERAYAVGGRLQLLSQPGKGTVVCAMIPMPGESTDE